LRYQDTSLEYTDPNTDAEQQGRNLSARAIFGDVDGFSVNFALTHRQDYRLGTATTDSSLAARNDFGGFTASLGLQLILSNTVPSGAPNLNTALYGTAGLEVPLGALRLGALQRVPLIGSATDYGDTTLSLEYALSQSFSIRLSDRLVYEPGGVRQTLFVGARGSFSNAELLRLTTGNAEQIPDSFGSTNIAAGYEWSNLAGDAGRARVGLDTSIPLGGGFNAQLGGEAVFAANGNVTGSVATGVLFQGDTAQFSARAQFAFTPTGIKQVYSAGATIRVSEEFVISPSVEYNALPSFEPRAVGDSVRDGGRFSVAAAWRAERASLLTNHTGRFGNYAPNGDELQGELQFGYAAEERLYLRSSLAYKFASSVLTAQATVGATYYLTDVFGLGANAAFMFQPATGVSRFGFGLEGSWRIVDNLAFSAGFNFVGFNGIGSFSSAPGFFLRLDWLFNEGLFR
jgi:hypothetical protein